MPVMVARSDSRTRRSGASVGVRFCMPRKLEHQISIWKSAGLLNFRASIRAPRSKNLDAFRYVFEPLSS